LLLKPFGGGLPVAWLDFFKDVDEINIFLRMPLFFSPGAL
jgi:hypothetical protein